MTEEEYFRKYYPDFCYGDKPLSPYWDLFQYGVEFGERESEDKIKELEDKLANADYQLEGRDNEIAELKQENKVLAQNLEDTDIVNKALEKENAELKAFRQDCVKLTEDNVVMARQRAEIARKLTKAKELIKELSKSLFLAKGIVRDLIDDTVDFKESKERASYCYEQESFDTYKKAEQFLKGDKIRMNIDEMKDRIARAEEIQRYTENRCEALEKENAELKKLKRECETSLCRAEYQYNYEQLTKAKHYIKELVRAVEHSYSVLSWQRPPIKAEAEQFLSEADE